MSRGQKEIRRISVIGLGKLGAPLAACFAARGFPTIGVDADPAKVKALRSGKAPVYEPGLQALIRSARNRLEASGGIADAVRRSDATFIVVPTPSKSRGGFSLRYVLAAAREIAQALRIKERYHLVALTSTVMPGATEGKLKPLLEKHSRKLCGSGFGLCYSPEFIALGSAIRDFLNPDFILIGESDPRAGAMLAGLYKSVCNNNPPIARMNWVNAELAKLAVNTYVTGKISFANMLARLCERLPDADVDVVTSALGLDSRIGSKYLKGAIGYGGPCFPRDNLALAALARTLGIPKTLAEATGRFNRELCRWLAGQVKAYLPKGGIVGILGLAYKPNSDVVEESQGLLLADRLSQEGIPVIAYDPAAENAREALQKAEGRRQRGRRNGFAAGISFTQSADQCVYQSDAVVVTTPWDEFQQIIPSQFARHSRPRVVIDCWRVLSHLKGCPGIVYVPLGVFEGSPASGGKEPSRW